MEIWKDIEGYPRFEVSNHGRARRDSLYIIDPIKENKYHVIRISNTTTSKHKAVHILVLEAFKPRPEGHWEVNHRDFQKNNNHLRNLEWVSRKQNMQHAFDNGRMDHRFRRGADNPITGSITPDKVKEKQRFAHNKDGDHPNYTLTDGQVLVIKKRRFNGEPLESIAREFNISEATVSMLSYGKRRKYVGEQYTLVPKVKPRKMKRTFIWVDGKKMPVNRVVYNVGGPE